MEKPTIEQTAWVMEKIMANAKEGGTFRRLIYHHMEYGPESYCPLYRAGGMWINNEVSGEYMSKADLENTSMNQNEAQRSD